MTSTHRAMSVAAAAAVLLASCGTSGGSDGGGGGGGGVTGGSTGFFITIHGMAFSPLQLAVPPGATVTVVNQDGIPHSVTSEATNDAVTPGAVNGVQFDTGQFTTQQTFTIPANAPQGAVVPYYCTVHRSAMATPNGSIRIDSSAQPGPAPGTMSPPPTPMPPGPGGGY